MEELKVSEEKYRSLVEQTNDIVFQIDKEGHITYISPNVSSILGYTPKKVWEKVRRNSCQVTKKIFSIRCTRRISGSDSRYQEWSSHFWITGRYHIFLRSTVLPISVRMVFFWDSAG